MLLIYILSISVLANITKEEREAQRANNRNQLKAQKKADKKAQKEEWKTVKKAEKLGDKLANKEQKKKEQKTIEIVDEEVVPEGPGSEANKLLLLVEEQTAPVLPLIVSAVETEPEIQQEEQKQQKLETVTTILPQKIEIEQVKQQLQNQILRLFRGYNY